MYIEDKVITCLTCNLPEAKSKYNTSFYKVCLPVCPSCVQSVFMQGFLYSVSFLAFGMARVPDFGVELGVSMFDITKIPTIIFLKKNHLFFTKLRNKSMATSLYYWCIVCLSVISHSKKNKLVITNHHTKYSSGIAQQVELKAFRQSLSISTSLRSI